jgi:uncharacterized protein (TIGR00730 family)
MEHIAIFCGSKFGENSNYEKETVALCSILGQYKKHIIYGGGNAGLMGAVANTVLTNGGTVTGIIPQFLNTQERINTDVSELIVTETMHQRKQLLFEKSDTAIILPGGFGTLDELFELLTWNQLDLHKIKVIIFNIDGFYDALLQHIEKMKKENFLYNNESLIILNNASEIISYL